MENRVKTADAVRVNRGFVHAHVKECLAVENVFFLYIEPTEPVNSINPLKITCSKDWLKELVVGRLLCEGYIEKPEDAEKLTVSVLGEQIKVQIQKVQMQHEKPAKSQKSQEKAQASISDEGIFQIIEQTAQDSKIHKKTAATHACYLFKNTELQGIFEDIGRMNSVNKAIGYMALKHLTPEECVLYTTGRVFSELVEAAAKAGIQMIISKSVTTDKAVQKAKECGVGLICRAWPDSFEILN